MGEAWVKRHCCIPDGFRRGAEFEWSDWQFWCGANYYRVRPDAQWESDDQPLFNQAFTYRRAQIVAPQKTGKGPWSASATCLEAVGPSQFLGWAGKGDGWACSDWGCGCGWEYEYLQGEPMAMRHPSPVIQLTANNEEQVGNVYRPLTAMIKLGPLSEMMAVREGFIRILGSVGGEDFDRIDAVTSSARGRVGNPVSWVLQDESGLYTQANKMVGIAETQRRGAAGMGGRTMETTNAWDPSENSTAQRTYQSQAEDIFKFFRIPPAGLSWGNKRDRRKILRYVYDGSPWVNLDSIEAEAVELNELDPAQAERFFGNRLVARAGTWLPDGLWESRYAEALAS
ncbi:terminase [Nocardia cyriacigeorgica]|uniref:Terminase n=1 Tax=Nocardia cyriacigeorgica TaxID=135487 RepID=A0ABX0CJK9_9NOCA|nr:terminase [Nocardia cyriacigeorgica]NEW50982.1 terminase [Nocardia cyriacigeorgica]NEW54435.1 terminase [Nocardia cyriacigeorgica]